jgi:hypothetical protein
MTFGWWWRGCGRRGLAQLSQNQRLEPHTEGFNSRKLRSVCDRYPLGTAIEGDNPVSQNISTNQTCVVPLFRENSRNYANRIQRSQIGTGKTYGSGVFRTTVCGTDRCYLAALTSLEELAVVGKDPTDHSYRCTRIQKRRHWVRARIFEADRTPSLNNIPRVHYGNFNARAWISLVEGSQLNSRRAILRDKIYRLGHPHLLDQKDSTNTKLLQTSPESLCICVKKTLHNDVVLDRNILAGVRMRPLFPVLFKYLQLCREWASTRHLNHSNLITRLPAFVSGRIGL